MSKLAELRLARGMTQTDLAKKIGASRRAVAAWELHEARPLPSYCLALSKLFKVSIDELELKGPPMA